MTLGEAVTRAADEADIFIFVKKYYNGVLWRKAVQ